VRDRFERLIGTDDAQRSHRLDHTEQQPDFVPRLAMPAETVGDRRASLQHELISELTRIKEDGEHQSFLVLYPTISRS
jgi:hypothetical protein